MLDGGTQASYRRWVMAHGVASSLLLQRGRAVRYSVDGLAVTLHCDGSRSVCAYSSRAAHGSLMGVRVA